MTIPTTERWLNRRQIVIGELQPRKHFPEAKVAELVESLKEHGFDPGISRLLVRPVGEMRIEHEEDSKHWFIGRREKINVTEGTDGWVTVGTAESAEAAAAAREAEELFELVIGECRYRASEIAGIELLPAAIQEMDDLTALKKQLVENMQRSELTAMEEAMAFARLREMGQTTEEIAQGIGRSREWVKDRLILCRLHGTPVADAIEEDLISASHGEVLAKVPSAALRLELLQKVLNPPNGAPAPWPREELDRHIKLDYLVDLRTAKFDKTDENLVPVEFEEDHEFENEHRLFGGACFATHGVTGEALDCPFATAPAGGSKMSSARMCTNPQCFQMKEIAAHERWRSAIASEDGGSRIEDGREVITLSHAENAELWNESGRALAFHSPYVELRNYPAVSELRSDEAQDKSWEFLILDQAVPVVLGRDTAGKVHELVRHDLAKKAAHLNGHKIFRDSEREQRTDQERSSTAPAPMQSRDERSREESLATLESKKEELRIKNAEIEAIVAAAEGTVRKGMVELKKDFWGYAALALATMLAQQGGLGTILARRQASDEGLTEKVSAMPIAERLGFVVECLVLASGEESVELWAQFFGVKLAAVRKAAEKKAKANVQRPTSNIQRPTEENKKPA